MSSFSIGLAVELVVGVLLIATIAYCFILDRRLRTMREGENALREIVASLDRATTRAQGAISDLRANAGETTEMLGRDIKKARALADELALMIEAGDHIADRLGSLAGVDDAPAKRTPADDDGETPLAAALRQVR